MIYRYSGPCGRPKGGQEWVRTVQRTIQRGTFKGDGDGGRSSPPYSSPPPLRCCGGREREAAGCARRVCSLPWRPRSRTCTSPSRGASGGAPGIVDGGQGLPGRGDQGGRRQRRGG